jgi:hypothetical protein
MNNSKTPKIVVGLGLVAAYSGLAFYLLRDAPDSNVAPSATTMPAAQMADASFPPPAIAPSSTDVLASVAEQPAVVTEAPSPVVRVTASSVAAPTPRAEPVEPKGQDQEQAIAREQPTASMSTDSATEIAEVEDSSSGSEIASAGDDFARPAGDAPLPAQSEVASSGNDSQITADVRTQIAAVAPASTIDVATTDGVVELSGSVPSHEEIDRVLVAARNVAHVRSVDISALMVSN